jgi:hypothetical protein
MFDTPSPACHSGRVNYQTHSINRGAWTLRIPPYLPKVRVCYAVNDSKVNLDVAASNYTQGERWRRLPDQLVVTQAGPIWADCVNTLLSVLASTPPPYPTHCSAQSPLSSAMKG